MLCVNESTVDCLVDSSSHLTLVSFLHLNCLSSDDSPTRQPTVSEGGGGAVMFDVKLDQLLALNMIFTYWQSSNYLGHEVTDTSCLFFGKLFSVSLLPHLDTYLAWILSMQDKCQTARHWRVQMWQHWIPY